MLSLCSVVGQRENFFEGAYRRKNTIDFIKNFLQALPASLLNSLVRNHSATLRALLPNPDAWLRLVSFRPPVDGGWKETRRSHGHGASTRPP